MLRGLLTELRRCETARAPARRCLVRGPQAPAAGRAARSLHRSSSRPGARLAVQRRACAVPQGSARLSSGGRARGHAGCLSGYREKLEGRDDDVPPPDLLDAIDQGWHVGVMVVTIVSDDLSETPAGGYLSDALAFLGQARKEA